MEAAGIDFAYRYPFSSEARELIRSMDIGHVDPAYVDLAKARVEEAMRNGSIAYKEVGYERAKTDYILGYVYSRMLVSAMKSQMAIGAYASAEARRSSTALEADSPGSAMKVCGELGIAVRLQDGYFYLGFQDFLKYAPKEPGLELVNQRLGGGYVALEKHGLSRVLEGAVAAAIRKGLPIDAKTMPKVVVDAARTVRVPVAKTMVKYASGSGGWIDRLVQTPIPDCRHRTVNLILAPYFVNVKGMGVEEATKVITDYINLCKTVNPNTNITERYIHYQCQYAKTHGMKPLSLRRAKDELFGSLDLEIFQEPAAEGAGMGRQVAEKKGGKNG